ncbi:hypothetical protein J4421_00440 [Candidatus Woesearchaeota archaeon]|nr:hypothetical protein [Candidatus Woesearchaeota archaeon]
MEKKGQLGAIELKFFLMGMILGIIVALALVFLGAKGVTPDFLSFLYK